MFPETADIDTSNDDYASRFTGSAGRWMLGVQSGIVRDFVGEDRSVSILDVGGGHGQSVVPLCAAGFRMSVLGSAESCRERIASEVDAGLCQFTVGNVIDLPYSDDSFDICIAIRMMTHCDRWEELVAELCRVAKRWVIVDYPTTEGVNAIAPWLFSAKKKLEGNTRTWHPFRHAEIVDQFAGNGFEVDQRSAQFFLPMVLHRVLKCGALSGALEGMCRALGLTKRWGSPVIVRMKKGKATVR